MHDGLDNIIAISNIPSVLSTYSWKAKMLSCLPYVHMAMEHGRYFNISNLNSAAAPWELNQYVALAATYSDGELECMPDTVFRKIINSFRDVDPRSRLKSVECVKNYLSFEIGNMQLPFQQDGLVLLFRYLFLMTYVDMSAKIDMEEECHKTFGIKYEDVFLFALLSYNALEREMTLAQFISYFCSKFGAEPTTRFLRVLSLFSIDREEFAKRQAPLIEFSSDGISNAINILEQYPVIKMGKVYHIPLPYLLNQATTRHLFDRLMQSRKSLRAKVGKLVMEPYVYKLLLRAGCYDMVKPEFNYKYKGKDRTSPDFWIKSGDSDIFVEVKLAEAPIELRQMAPCDIEKTIILAAKHVFQLFSRIKELCDGIVGLNMGLNKNKVFGVVVVHEDSYITRDVVYERCYKDHPELTEDDKLFMCSRIALAGLYYVESFCYRHRSILPALEQRLADGSYWNIALDTTTLAGTSLDLPFDEVQAQLITSTNRLFTKCSK